MAQCDVCGHNAWLVDYPCEHGEQCPFWVKPDSDEPQPEASDELTAWARDMGLVK